MLVHFTYMPRVMNDKRVLFAKRARSCIREFPAAETQAAQYQVNLDSLIMDIQDLFIYARNTFAGALFASTGKHVGLMPGKNFVRHIFNGQSSEYVRSFGTYSHICWVVSREGKVCFIGLLIYHNILLSRKVIQFELFLIWTPKI